MQHNDKTGLMLNGGPKQGLQRFSVTSVRGVEQQLGFRETQAQPDGRPDVQAGRKSVYKDRK